MSDYEKTPSFYNSERTFKKYLGETSYYLNLQNAVIDLIKYSESDSILELGSGLGHTTRRINSKCGCVKNIIAIDNRRKIINKCKNKNKFDNIHYKNNDMTNYVTENDINEQFILMLYSFHHIEDPNSNKKSFLQNIYKNMNKNSYFCIAEAFLPEEDSNYDSIKHLWDLRGKEGYASTFWNSLDGIEEDNIARSKKIGKFSQNHELTAGENVESRSDEYLVKLSWLEETMKNIGFDIILSEPVNAFNDYVVLAKK